MDERRVLTGKHFMNGDEACAEGALEANAEYGYVRMVNRDKCIGCLACVEACPYTPSRSMVAPDREYNGEE